VGFLESQRELYARVQQSREKKGNDITTCLYHESQWSKRYTLPLILRLDFIQEIENKSTIDVHKNSFVETDMPSGRGRKKGLPAGSRFCG